MVILGIAFLCAAYQVFVRFSLEEDRQQVRLVADLNGLKKIAAYEKKPITVVLDQLKKIGITELGVFEETLPDAVALGEVYYVKGSGIERLKGFVPTFDNLLKAKRIKPESTYLYIENDTVRKRIAGQLKWMLGGEEIKFFGKDIIEINEPEEELRGIGLGISEAQKKFLSGKGFTIVPRVWNDPLVNAINIGPKISLLSGSDVVVFDGEEILGFPDAIPQLAEALKKYKINYGNVEIVKQDGDLQLKKLAAPNIIRVHSVPKDELKKITKEEAADRYVRAVRERKINMIYLRPFLPPKMEAYPIEYNMNYFSEVKQKIEKSGFSVGKRDAMVGYEIDKWTILIIGSGIIAGAVLLALAVFDIPLLYSIMIWLLFTLIIGLIELKGGSLITQKILALLAAVVFPSYAVISSFSRERRQFPAIFLDTLLMLMSIVIITGVGIVLMVGLLTDYRFLSGAEVFPAVKLALTLPILIIAIALLLKESGGNIFNWVKEVLGAKVSLLSVALGAVCLAGLGILVARSGNFVLPVPGFEKEFRNMLEVLMYVRPRTKEFLIGYPILCFAAVYFLSWKKNWLWLLAAIGAIAPVSVFNSFSHIHTPLFISFIRTMNGLVLGIMIGAVVVWFTGKVIKIKDN